MGVARNISLLEFPQQGTYLNRRVRVCFNYEPEFTILGTVVRDDSEEPGLMIIKLDDDRYVLSTECQYSLIPA